MRPGYLHMYIGSTYRSTPAIAALRYAQLSPQTCRSVASDLSQLHGLVIEINYQISMIESFYSAFRLRCLTECKSCTASAVKRVAIISTEKAGTVTFSHFLSKSPACASQKGCSMSCRATVVALELSLQTITEFVTVPVDRCFFTCRSCRKAVFAATIRDLESQYSAQFEDPFPIFT